MRHQFARQVLANNRYYTVRKHWKYWPMWSVHSDKGPQGYVRAHTEYDALTKAIQSWGLEVKVEPFDGVL